MYIVFIYFYMCTVPYIYIYIYIYICTVTYNYIPCKPLTKWDAHPIGRQSMQGNCTRVP